MTPKELTEENISLYNLAKEAGFDVAQWAINGGIEVVIYEEGPITRELTRFAALVAAHERERMWCDAEFARQQEREACAKVCETDELCCKCGDECAETIRARGEK